MQHQQDKDFDSRIKKKVEDLAKVPPAELWKSIDEELNGPAAPRTNWLISGATWLMIAASVCLLAAAGLWLYRYQPFPERNTVALVGGKDSTSSPRPGVTILNKSRSRDGAKRDTGDSSKSGNLSAPAAPKHSGTTGQSRITAQAGTSQAGTSQAGTPQKDKKLQQTESGLSEKKTDPRPERTEPSSEAVIAAAQQMNEQSPTPVKERIMPVDELGKSTLASAELPTEDLQLSAEVQRPETEGEITDVAMEKKSIVPQEIREVSGVGDALNLVASTIDRSEDKFIRVQKDEESGKWDGVRLNLGILTISYNKPDKKSRQQRN